MLVLSYRFASNNFQNEIKFYTFNKKIGEHKIAANNFDVVDRHVKF